ncbi:hypothetical protein WJX82_007589 [Trebouxia sp. C0006]
MIPAIGLKKTIAAALNLRHHAFTKASTSVKVPTVPQPRVQKFGKLFDASSECIAVGGHRGNGQNLISDSGKMVPETRENTLSSFCRAVSNGATFIEFDVQVTSDGVPVIWHDNYVVTGDPKAPTFRMISEITLAEFKGLCSSDGFPASQPLLHELPRVGSSLWSPIGV